MWKVFGGGAGILGLKAVSVRTMGDIQTQTVFRLSFLSYPCGYSCHDLFSLLLYDTTNHLAPRRPSLYDLYWGKF